MQVEEQLQRLQIQEVAGGGGAGAGIGGNGGNGGQANISIKGDSVNGTGGSYCGLESSGSDGEAGENCGIINISNSLKVYSYGGSGAGSNYMNNVSSGCGGGGYPGAGIGGGGAGGGGGDHASGGGGYSGGAGEAEPGGAENGKTAVGTSGRYPVYGTGGAYFEKGTTSKTACQEDYTKYAFIGGQGAQAATCNSQGGDGGIAGKGGTIKVSNNAKVYAYNGNKYTDNLAGHEYNEGVNQLEVYAQNAILRAIYKYDIYFNMREKRYISFFKELFGSTVSSSIDSYTSCSASRNIIHKNYLVRPETTCTKSGYNNPNTNSVYGVGSGAGYIELSNGTYTVDNSLN